MSQERPHKRQRLVLEPEQDVGPSEQAVQHAPISPPPLAREQQFSGTKVVASPIRLTTIRDVPDADNDDAVSLHDLIGNPLIKEIWNFNYLHDIDFIMYRPDRPYTKRHGKADEHTRAHLDEDVQKLVQVKIIHGSWKREDTHRVSLEESVQRWPNVKLITAHMPQMFGTHHSKMLILIRHDDTAQVIIHTANMIAQDWSNLTQAIFASPLLPLLSSPDPPSSAAILGSGERFKTDLFCYLDAYDGRLRGLKEQLIKYDFSSIRAALIASTPNASQPPSSPARTAWGWRGLEQILTTIANRQPIKPNPRVHLQVSSVGTMTEKWIKAFFEILATVSHRSPDAYTPPHSKTAAIHKPDIHIIFPTEDEVRESLDGYASGSSIHLKLSSKAQQTQFSILKPLLRKWSGAGRQAPRTSGDRTAGRQSAAPHIKTYISFSDAECTDINWAMVTSANLSKQAWGELENKDGKVGIASYEIGVVLWPDLYAETEEEEVRMVPTFRRDLPEVGRGMGGKDKVVGLRMAYDLPLVPYGRDDMPWCAEREHLVPDGHGVVWPGFKPTI